MIKTVVIIPTTDNNGRPFSRGRFSNFEGRLAGLAGGFTVQAGFEGVWQESGTIYRDRSVAYVAALDSWMQLPAWLDLVGWAAGHFAQLAMYIEVQGVPEIIRPT